MEGILPPLPWNVARRTLSVPHVATPRDQPHGASFENFPRLYGLRLTDSTEDIIHSCRTVSSLTSFLQSWLFFELLSAFLETGISQADFVTDGDINLDKDAVHAHFRDWRMSMSRLSPKRRRIKQERMQELLHHATLQTDIFEDAAGYLEPNEQFDRVMLSIRLLLNLLRVVLDDTIALISPPQSQFWAPWTSCLASCIPRVLPGTGLLRSFKIPDEYLSDNLAVVGDEEAKKALRSNPNKFRPYSPGVEVGGRAAGLLLKIFTESGWCPYRALELCRTYDYLILNALSGMRQNRRDGENHQECLKLQRCTAHDLAIDAAVEYPFQHEIDGPHGCRPVSVDRKQIADIIMSDRIPLISLSLEGDLDLQVVQCTPYTTYTAVSHVWSDGLGNPTSNALPSCQLLRLRKAIFETYSAEHSPYFNDSTPSSRIESSANWEFWRASSASRPHFKIDKKRVYFWMDTLCIPVSVDPQTAAEDKDLKFRAMKHITPIFAGAFTTLVLDSGLQTLQVPSPSQVSGDEFAAMILGSKWMERGWTLEEGVLSSTCTFQIMGKPYEMSESLNHLLPKAENSHSPLQRASIHIRRLMPLVLRRGLQDERKRLSQDPLASRAMRLTKLLRIPQFAWTWNSLLQRSVTKEQDGPIILANLLDFNVSGLKFVPEEERLMLLIQNCDELPLSILYNTGARMSIAGHPEIGWIPQSISGDHIVPGASLRRTKAVRTTRNITYFIDRRDSDPESFLTLRTGSGHHVPHDVDTFKARARFRRHDTSVQEFIVEVRRSPSERLTAQHTRTNSGSRMRQQSQGTCFVVDLACGTASSRGFLGRGVQFGVESQKKGQVLLKYEAPLIIWSLEQWSRKCNRPHAALPCFNVTHVGHQQRLVLQYDASLLGPRLVRRPFHTQHPLGAKLAGTAIFVILLILAILCIGYLFVTIRDALGFRPGPSPHSFLVISVFAPILTMFVYDPIRRRLAMYAYVSWLKSFDGGYTEPEGRTTRARRSAYRLFRSGWISSRGLVSKAIVNLSSRRSRLSDIENELPGDIFLEE